jgi:hypothetical protein
VGASPEALFAAAFAPFASRLQLTSFASEDLTRMAALNLAIVADDAEPAPAPAKVAAKPEPYDARELSRRAVAAWPLISPHLYCRRGFAHDDIRALGPGYVRHDPSKARPEGWPRVSGLKGPSPWPDEDGKVGGWFCIGHESGGARGADVVALIVFLSGGASRRVCAGWLSNLLDRVVVVRVA